MEQATLTMENKTSWTTLSKFSFWFCLFFFGLNIFPFPLDYLPYVGNFIREPIENGWSFLVNTIGKIVFGIPEITVKPNGSGDTTWNWVHIFLVFMLSLFGAAFITLFSKRKEYNTLSYWITVLFRYYLACTMLQYGMAKVFPAQFGTLTTYRLNQELGDMSPMGLLWTFMAFSTKYQFFAGLMECLGGFLLFFRRTVLLGALISFGVMVNVFALNMCYDVPVKIYSFLLILMSLYLMAPNFKQLVDFFLFQKTTTSTIQNFTFKKKIFTRLGYALKAIFILGFVSVFFLELFEDDQKREDVLPPLYGAYEVQKFSKNGLDSIKNDTLRWDKMFIDRRGAYDMIFVTNDDGLSQRMNFEKDSTSHKLILSSFQDTTKYALDFNQPDSNSLIIKGLYKKDSLYLELKKKKNKKYLLTNRGFHWVNELPFNK
jgi:hypothetical protein